MKTAQKAFTLVEILVVLLLIGVVATAIMPRLFRRAPQLEWKNVADDVNNLVFFARQEAIANQKVYRLVFKSNKNGPDSVAVEQENNDPEKPGNKLYKQVFPYYFQANQTQYELPEQIRFKAVFSGKQDMLEEQRGVAYCYIVPDGLVQEVLVQCTKKIDAVETFASLKMLPFLGVFQLHEELIKPER